MEKETWLPIAGYEGSYAISDRGHVKSLSRILPDGRTWREYILKPGLGSNGYCHVTLQVGGKKKIKSIHRLVFEAFVHPIPPKREINHKNGIRTDNRLENLECVTHAQNARHAAIVLNSMARGERHSQSKLTNGEVIEIRRLWATGEHKQRDLAKAFGVTQRAVWQLIHRITWAHL